MSQLQTVLRRSVAHLDPSDHDGRERMFTSAREAMIRLLWSYDPPLTPKEIDSKIEEFDSVVSAILEEEPDSEAEPAVSDGDANAISSLITPEPEADEALEPEVGDAAEPAPFSASIALPPREPIRKLPRFQPLSQIGSPTPGKPDTNKIPDTIQTRDGIAPPAVPDANAAAIAALAAFDNTVGSERSTATAAGPVAARSAVHIGGDARSTPRADEDDFDTDATDPDAADSYEGSADTLDDLLFDVRDDELSPEDPAPDEDDAVEEDEAVAEDLDDDASQYPDEEATPDDGLADDDLDADRDEPDRLSAEDVLRYHRERFDDRVVVADDGNDDRTDEPVDEDRLDLDEEEPRRGLGERLREMSEAISGRMIAILAGVVLLLGVGGGGAVYLFSRSPTPASTASPAETSEPVSTRPTDIAGMIEAAPETPVPAPDAQPGSPPAEPRAVAPAPAPEAAAGALALETLNLFDGRDPSVFQSAPANPVRFEGDTQGGFARVSSSTNSTGSRITVGRGVYERLAGRTIRLVVVARGAKTNPASTLRFAFQNGRSLSPWHDGAIGPDYAPLSSVWTVPKERGGPETDAVLIEPGIPGDGTAVDIKSVRIEVLK
jgi:hypothetical protein